MWSCLDRPLDLPRSLVRGDPLLCESQADRITVSNPLSSLFNARMGVKLYCQGRASSGESQHGLQNNERAYLGAYEGSVHPLH